MRFPGTGGVECRIVQGGFQFLDAGFRGQNGGFHPFKFALLFEGKLSGTGWFGGAGGLLLSGWRLGKASPGRLGDRIPLLLLLQVIRIVARLDEEAAVLESDDLVTDAVQEVAVVADDPAGAVEVS